MERVIGELAELLHLIASMSHLDMNYGVTSSRMHLIIVCCHAIWLGGLANGDDESEWYIHPKYLSCMNTFFSSQRILHLFSQL